jgi:hypothetical protein
LEIGSWIGIDTQGLEMDDVYVFDRALSHAEVLALP